VRSSVRTIRVFVASPGDVQRERDSLLGVINEINRALDALVPRAAIRLELVRWETDVFPEMGRAQGVINKQIGAYDIFVGILWKRFGTPTGKASSGTEEEFQIAYRRWNKHGKPIILFYFNNSAIAPPRSLEDVEQLRRVVKFRQELALKGLTWEYGSDALFMNTVRPHLTRVIGRLIRERRSASAQTRHIRSVAPQLRDSRVTIGHHVTLTEIGPEDACYGQRSKYIGHTGILMEAEQQEDWLSGTIRFEAPLFSGDDGVYSFLQIRVEPTDSSWGTPSKARPNKGPNRTPHNGAAASRRAK
jgi:hypothetical protein